jgi:adenine-specific DNA-methyltransferase
MLGSVARQMTLHSIIYKRKKGLLQPAHDGGKPLNQAVSALLPTGNRARTAYLHCIKLSTNIDPPYNTGKDFIYDDEFAEETGEFLRRDWQYDEQGNRLTPNLDSNGRFHTDWLNMIYPRLRVARDLLSDDGVIFISIDDHELSNLYKICSEVFGESNFIEKLVWKRRATPPNDRVIGKNHEYILVFAKNIENVKLYLQPRSEELNSRFKNPDNDPRGRWAASDLSANGKGGRLVESCVFPIINPETNEAFYPPANKCWLYNKKKIDSFMEEGRIGFRENSGAPFLKRYLSEVRQGSTLPTILDDAGFSSDSAKEIKSLFKKDVFEFAKPLSLMKKLIRTGIGEEGIILDFFAGSSTTAHAVLELNKEDNGNRKFIMLQIPEATNTKSEAYKAGYKNLCEIGKDRIRRAGARIRDEAGLTTQNLDIGFRVLKLDSSNMKDVYYTPEGYAQMNFDIEGFMDNIKPDRSDEDLLFQVMLDLGIPLSAKIKQDDKTFYVNDNYLIACFGRVDTALITEIAKKKPYYAVFRDSSFINDSAMVNFEQVFSTYSPNTIRKVL